MSRLVFVCHIKGLLNIFLNLYPALYVPKRLVTSVAIVFEMIATEQGGQYKRLKSRGQRTADRGLGIGGLWTTGV